SPSSTCWVAPRTGTPGRPPAMWDELVRHPARALAGYRNERGTLEGYALVDYRTDLPRRDRFLEVDEIVWTSLPSRRALYAWLSSLADQRGQVLTRALPSHRLPAWV